MPSRTFPTFSVARQGKRRLQRPQLVNLDQPDAFPKPVQHIGGRRHFMHKQIIGRGKKDRHTRIVIRILDCCMADADSADICNFVISAAWKVSNFYIIVCSALLLFFVHSVLKPPFLFFCIIFHYFFLYKGI